MTTNTAVTAAVIPAANVRLTEKQSQRAECLRFALVMCAGRSVQMVVVWDIAKWLYDGRES